MKILKIGTIISMFILTACAPTYSFKQTENVPSATITRNSDSIDKGISFAIDDDGQCPLLGYVKDDKQRDITIPSGKRIWIQAGYNTIGAPIGYLCMIKESFIPKANVHYYAEFKTTPDGCSFTISRFTEEGKLTLEESVIREKYEMCMY